MKRGNLDRIDGRDNLCRRKVSDFQRLEDGEYLIGCSFPTQVNTELDRWIDRAKPLRMLLHEFPSVGRLGQKSPDHQLFNQVVVPGNAELMELFSNLILHLSSLSHRKEAIQTTILLQIMLIQLIDIRRVLQQRRCLVGGGDGQGREPMDLIG